MGTHPPAPSLRPQREGGVANPPRIKALIFDFDSLILETEAPIFQAWRELYQEYGHMLPLECYALTIGTSEDAFDLYGYLEELLGEPIPLEQIKARQLARYYELIAQLPVLPGVRDAIASAKDLGLKLALASSSPRTWVVDHLSRVGLLESFDCLRVAEDVTCVKPNPELYLSALAGLGVQPGEAVAFEDSANGIKAAKAAGIFCIAVPSELTRGTEMEPADYTMASLGDLPLPNLLAVVRKIKRDRWQRK